MLIGIPEQRILAAINTLIGKDMVPVASGAEKPPQVDIVSGATVTVLVIGDSIVRSAVQADPERTARRRRGGQRRRRAAPVTKTIDLDKQRGRRTGRRFSATARCAACT